MYPQLSPSLAVVPGGSTAIAAIKANVNVAASCLFILKGTAVKSESGHGICRWMLILFSACEGRLTLAVVQVKIVGGHKMGEFTNFESISF